MKSTAHVFILGVLTIIAAAGCKSLQSNIAEEANPMQQFLQLDPDERVSWNDETGDITVFGRFGVLESNTTARDFLLAVDVPRLAESDGFNLVLHQERTTPTGWQHLTYRQEIGGLPVSDQRLTIHINPSGEITGINGGYVLSRVSVIPPIALEPEEAVAVAVASAESESGSG